MTTFTLRLVKGHFVVTGPDIVPMRLETRREAKDWCRTHHPGSPIKEIIPVRKRKDASDGRGQRTAPEPTAARGKARAP